MNTAFAKLERAQRTEIDLFYIRGPVPRRGGGSISACFRWPQQWKFVAIVALNPDANTRRQILFWYSSSAVVRCILMNNNFDNFTRCSTLWIDRCIRKATFPSFRTVWPATLRLSLPNQLGCLVTPSAYRPRKCTVWAYRWPSIRSLTPVSRSEIIPIG